MHEFFGLVWVFKSWHFHHPYFSSLFGTVHCPFSPRYFAHTSPVHSNPWQIHSVIISLLIYFLKTATIPTYQGISIAFPRYIVMQHPSSHDLIFHWHTCFCLIVELHASWALTLSLLRDALVSLHILLQDGKGLARTKSWTWPHGPRANMRGHGSAQSSKSPWSH